MYLKTKQNNTQQQQNRAVYSKTSILVCLCYTTGASLFFQESLYFHWRDRYNNQALDLFSVSNAEAYSYHLSFHGELFPYSERRNEIAVIKDNLGMTCRLNKCPLSVSGGQQSWTNARWLVRMKTSEMETPRPEGKTELKQVRLPYLCLVINTEIMGCM